MGIISIRRALIAAVICPAGLIAAGQIRAQGLQYKAGDRVAAPFGTQYLNSVITNVDPGSPEQVSDPPTASQPPTVTFVVSGDSCQHPL